MLKIVLPQEIALIDVCFLVRGVSSPGSCDNGPTLGPQAVGVDNPTTEDVKGWGLTGERAEQLGILIRWLKNQLVMYERAREESQALPRCSSGSFIDNRWCCIIAVGDRRKYITVVKTLRDSNQRSPFFVCHLEGVHTPQVIFP